MPIAVEEVMGSRQKFALAPEGSHAIFADYPELLTPAHISKITGISVQYIRKMCREGDLPAVQIGRSRWFVPKISFIQFVMGENIE